MKVARLPLVTADVPRTEMQPTLHDMGRTRSLLRALGASPDAGRESGCVADGYDRFVSAVESDARQIVERKYAEEWNASRLIRRAIAPFSSDITGAIAHRLQESKP